MFSPKSFLSRRYFYLETSLSSRSTSCTKQSTARSCESIILLVETNTERDLTGGVRTLSPLLYFTSLAPERLRDAIVPSNHLPTQSLITRF
jgi:hypothetical protein